jgi:hypothetical protein
MAYLSQNHCMETLEFTMDAGRYQAAYTTLLSNDASFWVRDRVDHVCSLWEKLMQAYIIPYAPREVNLPGRVRDRLLGLSCGSIPPSPRELDDAVRIVYELMNDSVLVPFIESVTPAHSEGYADDEGQDVREGRSRIRIPPRDAVKSDESSRSPKFLPQLSLSRSGASRSASSSGEAGDREGLTDDSASAHSPPAMEPMTPPTTPPTSDWAFSTSPGGLQRALAAHNSGWKKVGAKLGLSRKGRPDRRSHPTSSASGYGDGDVHMSDASNASAL